MIHGLDKYLRLFQAGTLLETLEASVLVWTAPAGPSFQTTREFTQPSIATLSAAPRKGETVVVEVSKSLGGGLIVLGRSSECDVQIPEDTVSRRHARLEATRYGWSISDLGTKNGTWVGPLKVTPNEPVTLVDGARIQLGAVELFFMTPESFNAYLAQLLNRQRPA